MTEEEKTIQELPADQNIQMTDIMHRAFNAGGCNPICHLCFKKLDIDSIFKLATVWAPPRGTQEQGISVYTHALSKEEVMLCDKCTTKDFNKRSKENKRKYEEYRANGGGCMRINGKVVH